MAEDTIWVGGFDDGLHHTAGAYADHVYWGSGSTRTTAAARTGEAGMFVENTNYSFRIKLDQAYSKVIVGMALYMNAGQANSSAYNNLLFDWRDSSGNRMASLGWEFGAWRYYYGAGLNAIWSNSDPFAGYRDAWHYWELYFDPGGDTWQIRIDDQHIWTIGAEFGSYGTDVYYFYMGAHSTVLYLDDMYVVGTNDGSKPRFWGDTRVHDLAPAGSGVYSEWFGHDGDQVDNYLNVDQATPDMNAEHNFTPHPNAKDTYVFEDMPALGLGHRVRAVQCDLWGNYTGGPDFTADAQALVYDPGATPVPVPSPTTYTFNDNIDVGGYAMAANPATGLEWTEDDVNDSEFGFEYLGENP